MKPELNIYLIAAALLAKFQNTLIRIGRKKHKMLQNDEVYVSFWPKQPLYKIKYYRYDTDDGNLYLLQDWGWFVRYQNREWGIIPVAKQDNLHRKPTYYLDVIENTTSVRIFNRSLIFNDELNSKNIRKLLKTAFTKTNVDLNTVTEQIQQRFSKWALDFNKTCKQQSQKLTIHDLNRTISQIKPLKIEKRKTNIIHVDFGK